jgi:curved DNA-binding protein CbpA
LISKTECPFEILGVPVDASQEQIRQAYFVLVAKHPPDKDPEGFRRIREAFESARSPEKRFHMKYFGSDSREFWNPPQLEDGQKRKLCKADLWLKLIAASRRT